MFLLLILFMYFDIIHGHHHSHALRNHSVLVFTRSYFYLREKRGPSPSGDPHGNCVMNYKYDV